MTLENPAPAGEEVNPLLGNPAPEANAAEPAAVEQNTPAAPQAPDFAQSWRHLAAGFTYKDGKWEGGDAKELERLGRFTEFPQVWKSFRNLETKMSSGKFKPDLSDNPTPEELATYRKAVGVPEKPEGYFEKLPDGMVIGDADKPALSLFAERLHEKNVTPDVFNTVMETAFELIEHNQQEAVAAALEVKEASRQALYETWGPAEYKLNTNAIANILAGMPQSLRARFEGAQLADGNLMFNDVEAMKWWAQLARDINPALGLMPAGTGDVVSAVQKELDENRQMMRNPSVWFSKENAARRARHTELLEKEAQFKRR